MSRDKTLAELVEIRRIKKDQVNQKRAEVKLMTKEIRELDKIINVNLDNIVMTNSKEKMDEANYGYGVVKNIDDMKVAVNSK